MQRKEQGITKFRINLPERLKTMEIVIKEKNMAQ